MCSIFCQDSFKRTDGCCKGLGGSLGITPNFLFPCTNKSVEKPTEQIPLCCLPGCPFKI